MPAALIKHLIKILPDAAATQLATSLATRTQRPPVQAHEQALLDTAVEVRYGADARNIGWSWGTGPLVLLVHGWNGRAAQMAPLACAIAAAGFRAVAIEVTGHGASPGSRTGWAYFIRDIADLAQALSAGGASVPASVHASVHALVGHSAGGLSMMAARQIMGIHAKHYVCIAAPSHPYPPLEAIRRRLDPRPAVMARYQHYLGRQFGASWAELAAGRAYQGAGNDLLLMYDEKDRYVHHADGDKIRAWCDGAQLIKTAQYSHSKIVAAPEAARAVINFITE